MLRPYVILAVSIMLLPSCGEQKKTTPEEERANSWNVGVARSNAEVSCKNHFAKPNTTEQNNTSCVCVREEIEKRWTYDDFKAHENSYLETLSTDGTADRCKIVKP